MQVTYVQCIVGIDRVWPVEITSLGFIGTEAVGFALGSRITRGVNVVNDGQEP